MTEDRLAEIKAREFGPTQADADWLVGEVERLREELAQVRSNWARTSPDYEATVTWAQDDAPSKGGRA